MPEVVLFLRADGAVGQEDRHVLATEPANRVVRINPRIHPLDRVELGAWRPELRGQDRGLTAEPIDEHRYLVVLRPAAAGTSAPTARIVKSNMS